MNSEELPIVAIVGPGRVGSALGGHLHAVGVRVIYGVRDEGAIGPARDKVHAGAEVRVASAAASAASVVVLAVPAGQVVAIAQTLGDLAGKIVVDANNPVRWDSGPVWDPPNGRSVAVDLQQALPEARVVKAFNVFGAEFHADPDVGGEPADVPMASDHADAKATVAAIARAAGFRPLDAGGLRNAAHLESMALLWIHLASSMGNRQAIFQLRSR